MPACGVSAARVRNQPLVRGKDPGACGQVVERWWRRRRPACPEPPCVTGSSAQQSASIPVRVLGIDKSRARQDAA